MEKIAKYKPQDQDVDADSKTFSYLNSTAKQVTTDSDEEGDAEDDNENNCYKIQTTIESSSSKGIGLTPVTMKLGGLALSSRSDCKPHRAVTQISLISIKLNLANDLEETKADA